MSKKKEKIVSLFCPVCLEQLMQPLTESPCPSCGSDMLSILKPVNFNKTDEKISAPTLFLISSGKTAITFDSETPASAIFAETPEKSFENFWVKTMLSKMAGLLVPNENILPQTKPLLEGFHTSPIEYLLKLQRHIESLLNLYGYLLPLKKTHDKVFCGKIELMSAETEYVSDNYCIVRGKVKIECIYNYFNGSKNIYVGGGEVYLDITMPFVKIENKWIATDITPSVVAVQSTEEEKTAHKEYLVKVESDKQKIKEKAAKRKQNTKKIALISTGVITALVLLMLPYAITKSDGFFRIIAQPSMFICMLLCYLFLGIALLAGIVLVFGGLGNAISGTGSDDLMGSSFAVILISAVIYFGLSALLMNLGYINPFTGVPFIRPF